MFHRKTFRKRFSKRFSANRFSAKRFSAKDFPQNDFMQNSFLANDFPQNDFLPNKKFRLNKFIFNKYIFCKKIDWQREEPKTTLVIPPSERIPHHYHHCERFEDEEWENTDHTPPKKEWSQTRPGRSRWRPSRTPDNSNSRWRKKEKDYRRQNLCLFVNVSNIIPLNTIPIF